jgi:hypothetical protein
LEIVCQNTVVFWRYRSKTPAYFAWEEDALARIINESGCYPAFIQAYGRETWNHAPRSPIRAGDVQSAEALVLAELDDEFFHARSEKATERERQYMAAMADLGEGPYRTAEIAKRLGRQPSYTSAPRDSLIKKGLIYSPHHGQIDFTAPKFSPFMRRRYPLRACRSCEVAPGKSLLGDN